MIVSNGDIISIPTSKIKTSLILLCSIAFVVAGIWIIHLSRSESSTILIFSLLLFGFISISFFGICGLYGLIRLFDTQPGLVLDSEGIIDRKACSLSGTNFMAGY